MSADEELARMEHKRLNGSSRLTARARRAPSAPTLQAVLRQRTETTDTTTPMDTDDDSYPAPDSALQSQTKGAPLWHMPYGNSLAHSAPHLSCLLFIPVDLPALQCTCLVYPVLHTYML